MVAYEAGVSRSSTWMDGAWTRCWCAVPGHAKERSSAAPGEAEKICWRPVRPASRPPDPLAQTRRLISLKTHKP